MGQQDVWKPKAIYRLYSECLTGWGWGYSRLGVKKPRQSIWLAWRCVQTLYPEALLLLGMYSPFRGEDTLANWKYSGGRRQGVQRAKVVERKEGCVWLGFQSWLFYLPAK